MIRALILVLALAARASALEVPYLSSRINDHASLLLPSTRVILEADLKALEKRTGHQVAVLTIESLGGEILESYSLKVARTWALGHKGENDGILFLISHGDRKLRIEVGHGLEGLIPDALAGRIIQNEVVPRFRSGDFNGGVTAGVAAIIKATEGRYTPPPAAASRSDHLDKVLWTILMLFFILLFDYGAIIDPFTGPALFTIATPFCVIIPTMFWGVKTGVYFWLPHLILVPLIKVILPHTAIGRKIHVRGKNVYYGRRIISRASPHGSSSSGSGWASGGGGGGGGGFSGGGGSFGGGGASGSW